MRSAAATLAVAKYRPIRRSADMTTEPYRKVCSNCWQAVAAFQPRSQWCRPCVLDYQRRRRAAIKAGTWRPRPRSRSSDYPDAGSRERARRLQIVRDMIRVVEQRMERQQARMAALRAEEAALGDGLRTKRQAAEEAAGLVLVPITTPGRVGIIDEPGRPPAADPMRPPLIQELRSRAAPGYIP
jgi:hypothetical protein